MVLYDKKDENIDVYKFEGNSEKLKEFKRNVMDQHIKEFPFYSLYTHDEKVKNYFDRIWPITVSLSDIVPDETCDLYHSPIVSREYFDYDKLIRKYIEGEYRLKAPVKVVESKSSNQTLYNFLAASKPEEITSRYGSSWRISHMINLPEELYLLQLLEQGLFEYIKDEDISAQLDLFDVNFLKSVNLSDITEMIEMRFIFKSLDAIDKEAKVHSRILRQKGL